MGGTAHARDLLAQFQNGEERLVYARVKDAPDAPLYFLRDGTARDVREWAKEHLECFMPDCAARQLTTVSRSTRRDGFSHQRGAGGHAREGLFHQQAKALIVRWVTDATEGVVKARAEQATTSKDRRADVMLTWPDGQQVAVEIQYAPLTPDQWRKRHESYTEQGITCIWLLGHLAPHLRSARGVTATSPRAGEAVAIGALQQAMLAANVPLFWINPIKELIGTVWVDADPHVCEEWTCDFRSDDRRYPVPPQTYRPATDFAFFDADTLSECSIRPDGMHTPTSSHLSASYASYLVARKADHDAQAGVREARRRREAEEQRRIEVEARVAAARADRVAQEDQQIRAWLTADNVGLQRDWAASPIHARLHADHGAIPDLLASDLPNDIGVRGLAPHWHSALYAAHILDRPEGQRFGIGDCYKTLSTNGFSLHSDGTRRATAIIDFLKHLASADVVHIKWHPFRRGHVDYVRVLGDLRTAKANKERRARIIAERKAQAVEAARRREARRADLRERRRIVEQREREQARLRMAAQTTPTVRPAAPTDPAPAPATTSPATQTYTRCLTCRGNLADVLRSRGYHIGCEPSR